jgi:thiamine pyrophosphokinase
MLYGCVGGREDHTFANYALLVYARERGHKMTLVGKCTHTVAIINESRSFSGEPLSHLSLFAFGGDAHGVSISGAEYEAESITLTPSFPLGVSNKFLDSPCDITVERGSLLIFQEI